jgi:PHD/YefM family antitoxin component YafN of YafNO toxin-antitoxin module
MSSITANEFKVQGVSLLEERFAEEAEVIISVRGKDKYVVMELETYHKLREYELAAAVQEARADYVSGRVKVESVSEHMKRLEDV